MEKNIKKLINLYLFIININRKMEEWSFNKNRMLSVIERNENPKVTYYICFCFKRNKYKIEVLDPDNTLTDDLMYVNNPLNNNADRGSSQDTTITS
jgi:hypothetical protein